jgi:polygalacturonase
MSKKLLIILILCSLTGFAQTIRQDQVRYLPDSLLKKADINWVKTLAGLDSTLEYYTSDETKGVISDSLDFVRDTVNTRLNKKDSTVYFTKFQGDTLKTDVIQNAADIAALEDTTDVLRNAVDTLASDITELHVSVKDFGAVGDGITDDIDAIEAALAVTGKIYVPAGTYSISHPIRIGSNTHIILDKNATVYAADNSLEPGGCSFVRNIDTTYGSAPDSNIIIEGGSWDGNRANQTRTDITGYRYAGKGFQLTNVKDVVLRNMTVIDPTTFAICLTGISNFIVSNITFKNFPALVNQDGIHINPPANGGTIQHIYGNTGDDMVAFVAYDTTAGLQWHGAIKNISVRDLNNDGQSNPAHRAVRFWCVQNDSIYNISVDGVHGSYTTEVITFDTYTTAGYVNNISISNVDASSTNTPSFYVNNIPVTNLSLRNISTSMGFGSGGSITHIPIRQMGNLDTPIRILNTNFSTIPIEIASVNNSGVLYLGYNSAELYIRNDSVQVAYIPSDNSFNVLTSLNMTKTLGSTPSITAKGSDVATQAVMQAGTSKKDGGSVGARIILDDRGTGGTRWNITNGGYGNDTVSFRQNSSSYDNFGITTNGTYTRGVIMGIGTSNNGSTNLMALRDSDNNNVFIVNTDGVSTVDSLINKREKSYIPDDGEIVLTAGVAGWGEAMAGDNQEWASFRFSADGTVTLIANSTNAVNTDTDTKFCIYDAGTGIAIRNRLGSALKVAVNVYYYTP